MTPSAYIPIKTVFYKALMFEIWEIVESDYDGFTGVIGQKNSFPMIGYNGFEIRPGKL